VRFVHGHRTAETDHKLRRRDIEVAKILASRLDVTNLEAALAQNVGEGAAIFKMNMPEGKSDA
jgi:hypothetical protein